MQSPANQENFSKVGTPNNPFSELLSSAGDPKELKSSASKGQIEESLDLEKEVDYIDFVGA